MWQRWATVSAIRPRQRQTLCPEFHPPSPQLVKRVKPAQLSSLRLDAKALLAQGLPQAAIAYLERYI